MERQYEIETLLSGMQWLCRWQTLGVRWPAIIKRPCQRLVAPQSEVWLIGLSSLSDSSCFTHCSWEPYPCPFHSTPCQKRERKKEKRISGLRAFAAKIRDSLPSLYLSLHIPKWSCISILFTLLGGLMCIYACVSRSRGHSNSRRLSMKHLQVSVSVMCACVQVCNKLLNL